jgi:hypothetical protein
MLLHVLKEIFGLVSINPSINAAFFLLTFGTVGLVIFSGYYIDRLCYGSVEAILGKMLLVLKKKKNTTALMALVLPWNFKSVFKSTVEDSFIEENRLF